MPGGISVDLDALERFLDQLKQFDGELEESIGKVDQSWARLGETWHDKRYDEFARDWDAAVTAMKGYLEESASRIRFLGAKVRAAQAYLG